MADRLDRSKRDFFATGEPRGDPHGGGDDGRRRGRGDDSGRPRFVVQKHDASSLHYDVRLEVDGALASWAVPKGPSVNPEDKQLAIPTEDHPLEYADVEGSIPEGQYGAGTVLVWDEGTYSNRTERGGRRVVPGEALEGGHLAFWLDGRELRGGFALTRVGDTWLLVKERDEAADARRKPTRTEPRSVLSGKTLEEIAG